MIAKDSSYHIYHQLKHAKTIEDLRAHYPALLEFTCRLLQARGESCATRLDWYEPVFHRTFD